MRTLNRNSRINYMDQCIMCKIGVTYVYNGYVLYTLTNNSNYNLIHLFNNVTVRVNSWVSVQCLYTISWGILQHFRSHRNTTLVKFYLVLITLFCLIMVLVFTKNEDDQSDLQKMAWIIIRIIMYTVLVCLKQWSYNKTEFPNDQIRSTWWIASVNTFSENTINTI